MKSWLRCILIVNFRVRNKIPKIPNAHQVILKFFRKQNIKGYRKGVDNQTIIDSFLFFIHIICFVFCVNQRVNRINQIAKQSKSTKKSIQPLLDTL